MPTAEQEFFGRVSDATTAWIEGFVIQHNLCPFARREFERNSIKIVVTNAKSEVELVEDLESLLMDVKQERETETALLIHPFVLSDFYDFNQFLESADQLINVMGFAGELQIASFHPRYQFSGTEPDDAENYTNRSPYPMLHILREESLTLATENHPDTGLIPYTNIAKMRELGSNKLSDGLSSFLTFDDNHEESLTEPNLGVPRQQ